MGVICPFMSNGETKVSCLTNCVFFHIDRCKILQMCNDISNIDSNSDSITSNTSYLSYIDSSTSDIKELVKRK